jgi:hypothetical protein
MPATVTVLPRARAESQFAPCVVFRNLLCPAEPQLCRPSRPLSVKLLFAWRHWSQGVQSACIVATVVLCHVQLHVLSCLSIYMYHLDLRQREPHDPRSVIGHDRHPNSYTGIRLPMAAVMLYTLVANHRKSPSHPCARNHWLRGRGRSSSRAGHQDKLACSVCTVAINPSAKL